MCGASQTALIFKNKSMSLDYNEMPSYVWKNCQNEKDCLIEIYELKS